MSAETDWGVLVNTAGMQIAGRFTASIVHELEEVNQ